MPSVFTYKPFLIMFSVYLMHSHRVRGCRHLRRLVAVEPAPLPYERGGGGEAVADLHVVERAGGRSALNKR